MYKKLNSCTGEVTSLRGHFVVATGTVTIRGEHVERKHVLARAERAGATSRTKISGNVTLLVHGDLSSQIVVDMYKQHSQKIRDAFKRNDIGHHVCIVDSVGIGQLFAGEPAPCLHDRIIG